MDWDSLRQGASFGILEGVVKIAASLVMVVVVVRTALRWLRFPDRFIDDDSESDASPASGDESGDHDATAAPLRARNDREDADGEDDL
jgi:hypothetical protein